MNRKVTQAWTKSGAWVWLVWIWWVVYRHMDTYRHTLPWSVSQPHHGYGVLSAAGCISRGPISSMDQVLLPAWWTDGSTWFLCLSICHDHHFFQQFPIHTRHWFKYEKHFSVVYDSPWLGGELLLSFYVTIDFLSWISTLLVQLVWQSICFFQL